MVTIGYEFDKKTGGVAYENGRPKAKTSHTLNSVPCIVYDPLFAGEYAISPRRDLGITSLAATWLALLGFQPPTGYDPAVIDFS